jgi:hypothetical protein
MLSRLRKKTEASAASLVPSWHPNFRNYEKLPDIKVVRTAFFINAVAIVTVIALGVFLGKREYELRSLKAQVADWQGQINRDRPGSDQAVGLYRKFEEGEKRIEEVEAFVHSKPLASAFILHFAETRPRNIALDMIDLRDTSIVLRGAVRGAPELAAGEASAYIDVLKTDAVFGPKFEVPVMTALNRNPATNQMLFEIVLKFKAPGKGPKKT